MKIVINKKLRIIIGLTIIGIFVLFAGLLIIKDGQIYKKTNNISPIFALVQISNSSMNIIQSSNLVNNATWSNGQAFIWFNTYNCNIDNATNYINTLQHGEYQIWQPMLK